MQTMCTYRICTLAVCLYEYRMLKGHETLNVCEYTPWTQVLCFHVCLSCLPSSCFISVLTCVFIWVTTSQIHCFLSGWTCQLGSNQTFVRSTFPLQTLLITPPTLTRFDMLEFCSEFLHIFVYCYWDSLGISTSPYLYMIKSQKIVLERADSEHSGREIEQSASLSAAEGLVDLLK